MPDFQCRMVPSLLDETAITELEEVVLAPMRAQHIGGCDRS